MSIEYKHIKHNRKSYIVFPIKYKNDKLPTVLSYEDFDMFTKVDKKWRYNPNGFVFTKHKLNDTTKDVYLHEFVMAIKNNLEKNKKISDRNAVVHINRICLDNRRENLMFDDQNKKTSKNVRKRTRNTDLPKNSGIDANEVPTYVWYMKPNGSHGFGAPTK